MVDADADPATGERFDQFMERCLYGDGGFYATEGTAGRRGGDFITSPEVGPLFGAVLAEAIDGWWHELGRPEPFTVYDVGCGPGSLLKAVAVARPDRAWDLVGIDRVSSAGVTAIELPSDLSNSVVVANELLDNLPFRIIERGPTGFAEVFVGSDGEESLQPTDVELPIEVGTRGPLQDTAAAWVRSVLERNPGVLCLFDYGARTTAELADRGGWLRTYRDHVRGADPLVDPGRFDITTDIAWDQMPEPGFLVRQHEFLRNWGIDQLVEAGREHWRANAAAPDLAAIRMRSRVREAEALLDPEGLGSWWVATWPTGHTNRG